MRKIKLETKQKSIENMWEDFYSRWENCKKCDLHKRRSRVVFGYGDLNARIFCIGEAPGVQEDAQGRPFVGDSGVALRDACEEVGIDLEDWYLTNTCVCRPHRNRVPKSLEVKTCFPRLIEEFKLVNPEFVVFCGNRAKTILNLGEMYRDPFEGVRKFFIYHPASVLYQSARRPVIVEQLKKIKMEVYGQEG